MHSINIDKMTRLISVLKYSTGNNLTFFPIKHTDKIIFSVNYEFISKYETWQTPQDLSVNWIMFRC